jgi:hypothetical protein
MAKALPYSVCFPIPSRDPFHITIFPALAWNLYPMLLSKVPGFVKASFLTFIFFPFYYFCAANNFYRDPGSIFYVPLGIFERSYSLHRGTEAVSFRNEVFFVRSTNRTDSQPIWKAGNFTDDMRGHCDSGEG